MEGGVGAGYSVSMHQGSRLRSGCGGAQKQDFVGAQEPFNGQHFFLKMFGYSNVSS
jgi:hypothetical protein